MTVGRLQIIISAAALLFIACLWSPDQRDFSTVCSGYHSGALEGGGGGRESSSNSGPAAPRSQGWGHRHTSESP